MIGPIRLLTGLVVSAACVARAEITFESIRFNDLIPPGWTVRPQWSWHSIGRDPAGNIYVCFGGPDGALSDCVLFQYESRTGGRRLLGSFAAAARAAGTWREGERFEKGHSQIVWLDGRLYLGSQGFHDAVGADSRMTREALQSRGAHLFCYDPAADKLEDLGAGQPDGVFFKGRGFMTLAAVPDRGLIAALTVPHGDILLYNAAERKIHVIVPGVPEEFGGYVAREIIPAPNGKIYYAYTDPKKQRPSHVYACDLNTGRRSPRLADADRDFWSSADRTADQSGIYVVTNFGDVYRLHPESDSFEHLGLAFPESDLPPVDDDQFTYGRPETLGMVMSADGSKLYTLPYRLRYPKGETDFGGGRSLGTNPWEFCEFDLATRTARVLARYPGDFPRGYVTGSGARDHVGNIYFARHVGSNDNYGLIKISPNGRAP